mmetsp:Transcript_102352/g.198121  ORF Transcript_102352/g.198121 Transcript_102352/m.198121 type:complete len:727 (+) Transcript_102352:94-2274(+)
MASSLGGHGVWQAGSVVEVFSSSQDRWLIALVMQVSKGKMSVWLADDRGTLGLQDLSFMDLQLATVGTHILDLPIGFRMVPSRTRPGQVAYLDLDHNRKLSSRELAWRYHIENHAAASAQDSAPTASGRAGDASSSSASRPPLLPSGLCSAASLPRVPAPATSSAGIQPHGATAATAAAPGARPPRCGGAFCGAFCPLRMKKRRLSPGPAGSDSGAAQGARMQPVPGAARQPQMEAVAAGEWPSLQMDDAQAEAPPMQHQSVAAEEYADQVAEALRRSEGVAASQRSPLFHFPAMVSMGFAPAKARRALEITGGDLSLAVEFCVSERDGMGASQQQTASQLAPALPIAKRVDRNAARRQSPDQAPFDSMEDHLRAAEEAAAAADELHEDAVVAAIGRCEELLPGQPSDFAQPCRPIASVASAVGNNDPYDEAVAAAWERFTGAEHSERQPMDGGNPECVQGQPHLVSSQSQPFIETAPFARAEASVSADRRGSLKLDIPSAEPAEPARPTLKLAEEPTQPCGLLPCTLTQSQQGGQTTLPFQRGGRRLGRLRRHRSGRSCGPSAGPQELEGSVKAESEDERGTVKEAEEMQLEAVANAAPETPRSQGGLSATSPVLRPPSFAHSSGPAGIEENTGLAPLGSQLESLLAAAIDVPDDFDFAGGSATQQTSQSNFSEGDDAMSQAVAPRGESIPWGDLPDQLGGFTQVPATAGGTQFPASAWQPSARF